MGAWSVGGGWWWVRVSPNARGEGSECLAITMGHSGEIQRAGKTSIDRIVVFDLVQPDRKCARETPTGRTTVRESIKIRQKSDWGFHAYIIWVWNHALPVL